MAWALGGGSPVVQARDGSHLALHVGLDYLTKLLRGVRLFKRAQSHLFRRQRASSSTFLNGLENRSCPQLEASLCVGGPRGRVVSLRVIGLAQIELADVTVRQHV